MNAQKSTVFVVVNGRRHIAHPVENGCSLCGQHSLVKYRSHYGWVVTCTEGCGEVSQADRVLH